MDVDSIELEINFELQKGFYSLYMTTCIVQVFTKWLKYFYLKIIQFHIFIKQEIETTFCLTLGTF